MRFRFGFYFKVWEFLVLDGVVEVGDSLEGLEGVFEF